LKIGIIGCGMISGHHLTAVTRYPAATLVGVADLDLARARAQAERFGAAHAVDNVAELLALKPDVVHVLTPPAMHSAVVLQALEAGAHIYVEKPMGRSVAECNTMTRAALAARREICVGHNWVYSSAMMRALELIASGITGEVLQASAAYNYDVRRNPSFGLQHWAKSLPGGLAEDLAVHPVALLISVLGAPRRTFAVSRSSMSVPNANTADVRALIEADRGLGTLSVSIRARPDMALLDIWCERMLLRLNISSMTLTVHRDLPVPRTVARGLANFDVAGQLMSSTVRTAWRLLRRKVDGSYGIVPLVHAFYAALEAGKPAPIGPAEGTQAVAVLRSIWPALEQATPVRAA